MRTILDGDGELRRSHEKNENADWKGEYSNLDHYLVEVAAGYLQDKETRKNGKMHGKWMPMNRRSRPLP